MVRDCDGCAIARSEAFGFPNARREEVDRLRVAVVSLRPRACEGILSSLASLWDMLLMVLDVGHPAATP